MTDSADKFAHPAHAAVVAAWARGPFKLAVIRLAPGATVPSVCSEQGMPRAVTVLQLGPGLTPPITDVSMNATMLRCTVSVNGTPFTCGIPWDAVLGIEFDVGPDDAPRPAPPPPKRPTLRLID